jgi:uncharacterized protein (DUF58 family)
MALLRKSKASELRLVNAEPEALKLAAHLPSLTLEATRLAAGAAAGGHGRRRAGSGDEFWQYRPRESHEGPRAVDWRRSARGDRLFVRETEWSVAKTLYSWVDLRPGMEAGEKNALNKAGRGAALALATSSVAARGGERVAVLGAGRIPATRCDMHRMILDYDGAGADFPLVEPRRAVLLIVSDFYEPVDVWIQRLRPHAAAGADGILLNVSAGMEEDFPFSGRTKFETPGGKTSALLGRAELMREAYRERLRAHREELEQEAARLGFVTVRCRTDHPAGHALAAIAAALGSIRADG